MNYIIYDLEATCWETPPPGYVQEIIEIGAFRLNAYGEKQGMNEVLYTHGYGVRGTFAYALVVGGQTVDARQMVFAN